MVEDGSIMSAEYRLPLLAKTDSPCSAVSAIAELLVKEYVMMIMMMISQTGRPSVSLLATVLRDEEERCNNSRNSSVKLID